ncbi:MAG: serine hydrolase [Anaerolineae bacterium]
MPKQIFISLVSIFCAALLLSMPVLVSGQGSAVTAEAIGQANLRAATDVSAALLGQISAGRRYPVIGRSQFYPWFLLGDLTTQQAIGWVYADLVTVSGDLNTVPFTDVILNFDAATFTAAPTMTAAFSATTPLPETNTAATPLPANAITGTLNGEVNIRYGPGVDFPRIGIGQAGDKFEITARHTQYPWLQVRYSASPNGFAWIAIDLLDVQGNIYNLQAISQTSFNLPTLTPTPPAIIASSLLEATPIALSPAFASLGNQLWNSMLAAGYEPETSKFGALFVMNLRTGEALTFGSDVAFSGMSLNKIAILAALYSKLQAPPDAELAQHIAGMMVCSENADSNAVLRYLGDGDEYAGGAYVTDFMRKLGLGNTYIVAPYLVPGATPAPVTAPTTKVDQISAQPDYSNQMTADNLGWLLADVYQCANNTSGALFSALPGSFDSRECRQMLNIMSDNNLGEPLMMSAGVPANTRVAHKHGYINDTHGNAGIVFTPGGDYVLVVTMHGPVWLEANETFPLISDISRTVYDYLNPGAPVTTNQSWSIAGVDECLAQSRSTVSMLMSSSG